MLRHLLQAGSRGAARCKQPVIAANDVLDRQAGSLPEKVYVTRLACLRRAER